MKKVLVFIGCGLLVCGCQLRQDKQAQAVQPIPVVVERIVTESSVVTHTYVGELEDTESVSVSAMAAGKVTRVAVKNNDKVYEGQVLLTIDDTQARNALQSAQAQLDHAREGYERVEEVYKQGGVTEMKLIEVRAQYQTAQSLVAIAQKEVDNCTVRAPQAGVVADMDLHVGQTVMPSIPLLKLLNMNGLYAVFNVPEMDIDRLRVGDKGRISVAAVQSDGITGKVSEISMTANRIAHTYKVKMLVNRPQEVQLLPGMVCKIQLEADTKQGFLIPAACVQTRKDGLSVWVVEEGKARQRGVEIAGYAGKEVIVKRGLQRGDVVVVSGYQKLYKEAEVVF